MIPTSTLSAPSPDAALGLDPSTSDETVLEVGRAEEEEVLEPS
jgi:hypothetical protein